MNTGMNTEMNTEMNTGMQTPPNFVGQQCNV